MKVTIKNDTDQVIINPIKKDQTDIHCVIGSNCTLLIVQLFHEVHQARVNLEITGQGSSAKFIGLVYGTSQDKITIDTFQHHTTGGSTTNVLVKSVLDKRANFAYSGTIKVEKNAQKTDAYQRNDNLLLSDSARASSKPILEILANDLRCTHGATTGNIQPEEVWFLENRGISKTQARSMIAAGFLENSLCDYQNHDIDSIRNSITELFV